MPAPVDLQPDSPDTDAFMKIIESDPMIGVVRLPHAEGLALPSYETAGAAGTDLRAAVPEDRPILILPGRRALVPTGLVLEIPKGFEGQVRPRSGLALKYGVTCLNTPGTIDSDYRGEVKVLLVNLGDDDFVVTRGIRSSSRRSPVSASTRKALRPALPAAPAASVLPARGDTKASRAPQGGPFSC
jgi:dUTP pyrophosphatase